MAQDPTTQRVLILASTYSGLWAWVSADGGLTFSEPRHISDRLTSGLGQGVAFDGNGGFSVVGGDVNGRVDILQVDNNFATTTISPWEGEDRSPYALAALGPAFLPVALFFGGHLRFGYGSGSTLVRPRKAYDVLAGSPVGGLIGRAAWAGKEQDNVYVSEVRSDGTLGTEIQLNHPSFESARSIQLATAPNNPSTFLAAYAVNYDRGVYVAQSDTGPSGPWRHTQVLNAYTSRVFDSGRQPMNLTSVSEGLIAGTSATGIWVTDLAPTKPTFAAVRGTYSIRAGKLNYAVFVESAAKVAVSVRVKAGSKVRKHSFVLTTTLPRGELWTAKRRLPRRIRTLAAVEKSKMKMTARAVVAPGLATGKTVKVRISRRGR